MKFLPEGDFIANTCLVQAEKYKLNGQQEDSFRLNHHKFDYPNCVHAQGERFDGNSRTGENSTFAFSYSTILLLHLNNVLSY